MVNMEPKCFQPSGMCISRMRKSLPESMVFFKAAAVGAIALVLNDIERLIAFVAFSHAGNDIYHKLCVLEPCIPNDDGIYILNILGDDQRQLAYIEDDLRALFACRDIERG